VRNAKLTYEDVLRIVELVKSTHFSEFRLRVGEVEVHLRRNSGAAPPVQVATEEASPPAPAESARRVSKSFPEGAVLVRSPMVGTFYRAPAPDAPPFVEVGTRVEPSTTVCIIEVMKLMNSIVADAPGVVTEILVENGAYVEYGEALIVISPD
jgi:acetyl-CoA carboxylase biotin carboxyl carrier protein